MKPQQRLFILSTNLIPSLYHQLVLTATSKKYLKWLDRSVRAAVRSWLSLPHDTPKAYFHSKIFDGGLGTVTVEHQVPLMKIRRIDRFWASNDPVIREMLSTEGAESLLARKREPSRYGGCRSRAGKTFGWPSQTIFTLLLMAGACARATLSHTNISGLPKPRVC